MKRILLAAVFILFLGLARAAYLGERFKAELAHTTVSHMGGFDDFIYSSKCAINYTSQANQMECYRRTLESCGLRQTEQADRDWKTDTVISCIEKEAPNSKAAELCSIAATRAEDAVRLESSENSIAIGTNLLYALLFHENLIKFSFEEHPDWKAWDDAGAACLRSYR